MNNLNIKDLQNFVLDENKKCKNGKTYESVIRKNFPDIYNIIKGEFFKENLYMLLYDIKEHPLCPICHKPLPLRNWIKGFQKTCSKECLGKFQSISEDFKNKLIMVKKEKGVKLSNLKIKYPDLNIDYNYDTKQYIVKNYCKHGDLYFQTNLKILDKLYQQNKCLCPKCNKEFIANYNPTEEEILSFKNIFPSFRKKYKSAFSEQWFIQYYPKEYKILLEWSKNEKDISLLERIILFDKNLKTKPVCSVKGCNNKCKWGPQHSTYYAHCEKHINYNFQSKGEKDLKQFLNELNIKFESNVRNLIPDKKEIDIYIPDMNLAIEYNGIFWHNEKNIGKNKTYSKWKLCKEKGIQLLTIWEDSWKDKNEIVKDIIRSKLNLNKRIYARNCSIKEIDHTIEKPFLNNNHLQGWCNSQIKLGLFYNNELIGCMAFGKSRFKKNEYELIRFAILNGYNIIGGFSKLLKYFIKNYINNTYTKIISYADCDISIGNVYLKNGFKEIHHILNYWWGYKGKRYSRQLFMKSKLIKQGFNPDMSETEIMYERGYYKVYGSGNLKYEMIL